MSVKILETILSSGPFPPAFVDIIDMIDVKLATAIRTYEIYGLQSSNLDYFRRWSSFSSSKLFSDVLVFITQDKCIFVFVVKLSCIRSS